MSCTIIKEHDIIKICFFYSTLYILLVKKEKRKLLIPIFKSYDIPQFFYFSHILHRTKNSALDIFHKSQLITISVNNNNYKYNVLWLKIGLTISIFINIMQHFYLTKNVLLATTTNICIRLFKFLHLIALYYSWY